MPKPLDAIPLDDEGLPDLSHLDREPFELVDLITRLLATKDYEWARDTLDGIRRTVVLTNTVTRRQAEAVTHIMVGRLKHDSHRP